MEETLGIIIAYTYVGLLYLVGIYYYTFSYKTIYKDCTLNSEKV